MRENIPDIAGEAARRTAPEAERPLRDLLLLFQLRRRYPDFKEHLAYLRKLLEDPPCDPALLRRAIALALAMFFSAEPVADLMDEVIEILQRSEGDDVFDALPVAAAVSDEKGAITKANALFREWFGPLETADELLSETVPAGKRQHLLWNRRPYDVFVAGRGGGLILAVVEAPTQKPEEEFVPLLKRLRKEKGWTLAALARELRISRGYLHAVETGRSTPSYELIERLADLLDDDGARGLLLAGVVARIPERYRAKIAGAAAKGRGTWTRRYLVLPASRRRAPFM